MKRMISRRMLTGVVLLCAVLSMVGGALMPAPDGVVTSTTDVLVASAWVLDVVSWTAVPLVAWLVSVRMHRIRRAVHAGASFAALTGQYIGALTLLALLAEAPYDYTRSGQWWDASSQNPIWSIIIALVAVLVWEAVDVYGPHSKRLVRVVVILTAFVWAVAFRALVSITLLALLLLLWPADYTVRWKKLSLNRQAALVLASLVAGGTPLLGTWLIGHVKSAPLNSRRSRSRADQWTLWWAYPLVLILGVLIRMGISTWIA